MRPGAAIISSCFGVLFVKQQIPARNFSTHMKPFAKHLKQVLQLISVCWALASALPVAADDSLSTLTARAVEAEQNKQFPLALLIYDQCHRLAAQDAELIKKRNACADACANMPVRQATLEEKQEIIALRDTLESAQNKHDLAKLKSLYSSFYINNDGLNRDTILKAIADIYGSTPDLHNSIQIDNTIAVSGDLALVRVLNSCAGTRYVSGARGIISSQMAFLTLLKKENGKWGLCGDFNYADSGNMAFGDAQAVNGSLIASSSIEEGGKLAVRGAVAVPYGYYVNGSLTAVPNKYPIPQVDGGWQVSPNGSLEKVFDSPADRSNFTVFGTFQILRAMDNFLVGVKTLSQRVNLVAQGVQKPTNEVLAAVINRAQYEQPGAGTMVSVLPDKGSSTEKPPVTAVNTSQTTPANSNSGKTESNSKSKDTPIRDKWALIIGISNFRNPDYNLKVAAKDAQDFCNYLVNEANFKRDHVLMLLNEKATRENIMTAFGDQFLPAVCEPGDMIVVYVSTHGTPKTQDKGGRNYIVAYDTDASKLYATGVDMDELYKRIREGVKTDRALIVLDTCYSGAGVPGSRGLHRGDNFDANEVAQGCGQLVISSSSPNERSWESRVSPNGVFTKYLVETLREKKGTDVKTAFAEVQKKVEWEVKSVFGEKQTPQLGGNWQGKELILSLPPTESRPVLNPELLQLINSAATTSATKSTTTPPGKK